MAHICENCKVLIASDRSFNIPGVQKTTPNGNPIFDSDTIGVTIRLTIKDSWPDFPVLRRLGEAGCVFCGFLRYCIQEQLSSDFQHWTLKPDGSLDITICGLSYLQPQHNFWLNSSDVFTGLHYLCIPLKVQGAMSSPTLCFLTFDILADEGSLPARHLKIHRRLIDPAALSDRNKTQIMKWIHDCVDHGGCQTENPQYLPTRLIDVGCEVENPRLVHTASELQFIDRNDSSLRYIAFSYCWGSPESPFLKTEKISLRDRCGCIRIDVMPVAFKDLITLSRELGIRYLWIDALCIIQDDETDWRKEAALMKDVYANAYLTVAASSIESPHEGFLHRHLEHQLPISYTSESESGVKDRYWIRLAQQPLTQDPLDVPDFYRDIHRSKWFRRGWTLQEEQLSSRVLYFGSTQMYFQCKKGCYAENTIAAIRSTLTAIKDWYFVIVQFTLRELSNYHDKLPAIAGLADAWARKTGDAYLAGLFRSDLVRGLLWGSFPTNRTLIRTEYRAPSWTWAAYDGSVGWYYEVQVISQCHIVDAQTYTAHYLGRPITWGFLEVSSAKMELVKARQQSQDFPLALFWNGKQFADGQFDCMSSYAELDQDLDYNALLVAKFLSMDGTVPSYHGGGLILRSTTDWDGNAAYERLGQFRIIAAEDMLFFGKCGLQTIRII